MDEHRGPDFSARRGRGEQRVGVCRVADHIVPAAAAEEQVEVAFGVGDKPASEALKLPRSEQAFDGFSVAGEPGALCRVDKDQVRGPGVVVVYAPDRLRNVEDHNAQGKHEHHDSEEQFLADVVFFRLRGGAL